MGLLQISRELHGQVDSVWDKRHSEQKKLPGDPIFNQFDNPWDEKAYDRICDELGKDPLNDFRFKRGMIHGLGSEYLYMYDIKKVGKTEWAHFAKYHIFGPKHIDHI